MRDDRSTRSRPRPRRDAVLERRPPGRGRVPEAECLPGLGRPCGVARRQECENGEERDEAGRTASLVTPSEAPAQPVNLGLPPLVLVCGARVMKPVRPTAASTCSIDLD